MEKNVLVENAWEIITIVKIGIVKMVKKIKKETFNAYTDWNNNNKKGWNKNKNKNKVKMRILETKIKTEKPKNKKHNKKKGSNN